jgi:hypothetical protein
VASVSCGAAGWTGVLIFQRNTCGLWLGVAFAGLSAMLTVIVMFVFPLWRSPS